MFEVHIHRNISSQNHHLGITTNAFTVFDEAGLQFRCLRFSSGQHSVDIAILHNEFGSCLFSDTGNSHEVVTRVTTQSRIIGILSRGNAGALYDACFVVQGVITDTAFVVEHSNVRVPHQLITVTVASHNDQVVRCSFGFLGHCRDEIVAFKADLLSPSHTEDIEELADHSQLLEENVRRLLPLCFVFGNGVVTKCFFGPIENNDDAIGLVITNQRHQHGGEAVHRVSDLPTCIRHVVRQCVKGPIRERVSVESHDQHGVEPFTDRAAVRPKQSCRQRLSWCTDDSWLHAE